MSKQLATDYNPDEIPTTSGPAKALTIPSEGFIVFKLLVDTRPIDPVTKKPAPSRYYSFNTHTHTAEIKGKSMNLPHPCGHVMYDECPECDRYYQVLEQTQAYDKKIVDSHFDGKWPKRKDLDEVVMQDPEYRKLAKIRDKFKPSKRAILLVNLLGSDRIEALSVSQMVIDKIFGKTAYKDKPAVEGLYAALKRDGYNIFKLTQPTEAEIAAGAKAGGWLKAWSSGSVGSGDYEMHVEHYMVPTVVEIKGKKKELLDVCETTVNPAVFKLTQDDLPDVKAIANAYGWTLDQIQDYVDSNGTKLPEFGKKKKKAEAPQKLAVTPPEDPSDDADSDDDDSDVNDSAEFDDSINF